MTIPAKAACLALALAVCTTACGKKGPPLPPLVKLPIAPADLTAERRGDDVTVQFTIPASNTDNTKPANIERVDVYALTGPASVPDDILLKRGTVVGSVAVKAPRDPDQAVDADESDADVEPAEGAGLDQGAVAHIDDRLTTTSFAPADITQKAAKDAAPRGADRPLLGPDVNVPSRVYAGVGITTRGKKGRISRRVAVPLVPPPPAPPAPDIAYDEKAIHVSWGAAPEAAVLPSHPLGVPAPALSYYVYDVAPQQERAGPASTPVRLTNAPVEDRQYEDARMDWGKERCYSVRTLESFGDLKLESDPSAPACVTLRDTFPPGAPHGLRAVGTEGAISLIWDASNEADLAGYLVVRGPTADALEPVTPTPIVDTNFRDTVPAGARFYYAVVAVDRAGNRSPPSEVVAEAAR